MELYQKKCRLVCALLLLCAALFAVPRGAQELVTAGSPIYDRASALFLEAGLWNFADSVPVTVQELEYHLSEIDYDSLSEQGKEMYDSISGYFAEENFSFGEELLNVGLEPSMSLEAYYKSARSVDWTFDRYSRRPALDGLLSVNCAQYFTIMCDLYLGMNRCAMTHNDVYTNVPLNVDHIDINFPTTAYFSSGTIIKERVGVSFQLGMAERAVGRTLGGSAIVSEYMTGATYAQLSAYSHALKFTTSVQQLNVDRYFYFHKLEVRPTKKLTLTALEGQLAAHPLELRFLNPLTIFHGFSPWREYHDESNYGGDYDDDEEDMYTCAYFGLKAVWVPVKYLRVYGLFAMTQYQTPWETKNWADSLTPNGMGGQLGIESYIPLKGGYVHIGMEGYYAQPYLYLKPSPNSSLVRTYSENLGDKDNIYEWVGSPFGPDTIAATAVLGYERAEKWSLALRYLFLAQGELSDSRIFGRWGGTDLKFDETRADGGVGWRGYPVDTGERDQTTPSGIPQFNNRFSLRMSLFPAQWLELIAQPSYAFVFNTAHIHGETKAAFEIALAGRIKFCRIKK